MLTKKQDKLRNALRQEGITDSEAIVLVRSARGKPERKVCVRTPSTRLKYGYFSDPHIGEIHFRYDVFEDMVKRFKQESIDFIVNPGDHLEGMSGRPGHIYQLSHVGFNQQIDEASRLYGQLPFAHYGIDGNHDQWYFEKNNGGVVVGKELEHRVRGYRHLGQWEGTLDVAHGLKILLFHANDGTAYADSYKLQKLIESFEGSKKPNIVHSGHYHKSIYLFRRNVHGFESGTLCGQSQFMRGKKIPAHIGYGIVDLRFNKHGVKTLNHTFVPFYD